MLHTRQRLAVAVVVALVCVLAAPASVAKQGPELRGSPAQSGKEVPLQLRVPPDSSRPTVKVRIAVPAGFAAVRCKAEGDWSCRFDPPAGKGPAIIEWTRVRGNSNVEEFSFSLQTPRTGGRFPLEVTRVSAPAVNMRYGPDSGAPVLEVVGPAANASAASGDSANGTDSGTRSDGAAAGDELRTARGEGGPAAVVSVGGAVIVAAFVVGLGALWWRRRRPAVPR